MTAELLHSAFIGPGGPELLIIMLVLLLLFGAKDAPRILRKLNDFMSQIRNTADGFKREVMYGDLNTDPSPYDKDGSGDDYSPDDDYDGEGFSYDDVVNEAEPGSAEEGSETADKQAGGEDMTDEGDDVRKA